MKPQPDEYEVTVTPDGEWSILHLRGEKSYEVVRGCVVWGSNVMGRAEMAARDWISTERNKKAEAERRARGNHVFRVKV